MAVVEYDTKTTGEIVLPPSLQLYGALQLAYDFYNEQLFEGRLPQCLITLQRHRSYLGFFHGKIFVGRGDDAIKIDELAMNPDRFDRDDTLILSTLVHEMTHVEQAAFGQPSRNGYHNGEWGKLMKRVGLYPSSTAAPGGAETGQRVSHYIIEGGRFAQATARLIEQHGMGFTWRSLVNVKPAKDASKNKIKYETRLLCGECEEPLDEA